ncbi:hypothetical protein FS837_004213 [Tulasnella sp. UAMH 9824]|nr:hypothetical protein FS837_004213 [Tulasnella sp. UAMH 9824]
MYSSAESSSTDGASLHGAIQLTTDQQKDLQRMQQQFDQLESQQLTTDSSPEVLLQAANEWKVLCSSSIEFTAKIAHSPLPPDPAKKAQQPAVLHKTFSNANSEDLLRAGVDLDVKVMEKETLLENLSKTHKNKLSDLLIKKVVSFKKEAGARIFIDLFVLSIVGLIEKTLPGQILMIPEMVIAVKETMEAVIYSPDKLYETHWSGSVDYGICFWTALPSKTEVVYKEDKSISFETFKYTVYFNT